MSLFLPDPGQNPLADRMRPRRFDQVLGQEHLTAPGAPFRTMVEKGNLSSAVLWGPPGVGKTTLARLVADVIDAHFVHFSAVLSGIKEVREVMAAGERERALHGRRTLLFVDEIHRFNKAQQDAFLPHVECGNVILLGATTENPSFEIIPALLSRLTLFVLQPLGPEATRALVERALGDDEHGLGRFQVEVEHDLLEDLVARSDGDARRALNAIETLAFTAAVDAEGKRRIRRADAARALERGLLYDRQGERHYDTISAFIKSVRNSDPDAAVYWLARMLEAGEDPLFIARRIVILASEDVGLADPQALPLAVAAHQATHFLGMPEARLTLTEATLYLALAPKSNSALTTYENALKDVRGEPAEPVPLHLRNAPTGLMKSLGYGHGYRYAHTDAEAAEMDCLPASLTGRRYYRPASAGVEPEISRHHASRRRTGGNRGG